MNVIRYDNTNYFTNRVALLIDFSNAHQILAGNSIFAGIDDFDNYMSAMKSMFFNLTDIDTEAYQVFTVDLLGYRELYVSIDDKLFPVFRDWQKLLNRLLQNDMASTYENATSKLAVLSHATGQSMKLDIVESMSINKAMQNADVSANRLINIAFPANWHIQGFFTEVVNPTELDTNVVWKTVQLFGATEYGRDCFDYAGICKGQVVKFAKSPTARTPKVTITVTDVYNQTTEIICQDVSINELQVFAEHVELVETEDSYELRFVYAPTRIYNVVSNSSSHKFATITPTCVHVKNDRMRKHAIAANLLLNDRYIASLPDNSTPAAFPLPAVYQQKSVHTLPIRSYNLKHLQYRYKDVTQYAAAYVTKVVKPLKQWFAGTYLFQPVYVGSDVAEYQKKFAVDYVDIELGNLHTFLIDTPLTDTAARANSEYLQLHTNALIADDYNEALSHIELPTIYNNEVQFRNITYKFTPNFDGLQNLNGKKFALVLHHETSLVTQTLFARPKLLQNSNYVILQLTCNLTKVLTSAQVSSVADLTIADFYIADMTELLPQAIKVYVESIFEDYTIAVDYSASKLTMDLPLQSL